MTLTSRLVARGGRLYTEWSDGTLLPLARGGDGDASPLAELLAQAAAERVEGLSDDELATLDADLTAAAEAVAEGDLDDQAVADLNAAADAVQRLRAEAERRDGAAQARADEAAAALAAIRGEGDEGEGDGEPGEGDPAEPEAEPAGGEAEPETPPAEPAEPEGAAEPEPIAAGGRRRPPITRVAARRPAQFAPRPQPTPAPGDLASLGLTAAANAPGLQAGTPITNYDQLAAAFVASIDATRGYRHGPRVKVPVVRIGDPEHDGRNYPDGYRLDSDHRTNMRRIQAAQQLAERGGIRAGIQASGANSLAAAGGICAPQQVNYDMPTVGSTARPIRDQYMMRFGADRGGVRTIPPPTLADVDDGAVIHWTELNDQTPGADPGVPVADRFATKPCLEITCPDEDETLTEAITRCLQTGNFRARFFPEQVEAWMRLVTVWQARYAERRLLTALEANDVAMTQAQVLSSTRDVLTTLDRVVARWRNVFRLDDGFTIQLGAPRWFLDQMRADIARQLPVGSTDETLAVAEATITGWFRTRNVDPVWFMEGVTGQDFAAQGAGAVAAWPATVKMYLSAPGAWLFLDGGSLDLGIVRDSTLNGTNDAQMFAETWEGAHFHSALPQESLTLTSCPDGAVAATTVIDTCA
jgi:hypothetical protein